MVNNNKLQGIDISIAQGTSVDMHQVANSGLVDFLFMKVSQGQNYVDPSFFLNKKGAKEVGLIKGFYHFASAQIDDYNMQADHFINTVGDLDELDILALDMEVPDKLTTSDQFNTWVLGFLDRVEQKTGRICLLYTGGPFMNTHAGNPSPEIVQRYLRHPLWLACYTNNPQQYIPNIYKSVGYSLHQVSGDVAPPGLAVLHVPGIGGAKVAVDRDWFIGSRDDLVSFARSLNPSLAAQPQNTPPEAPIAPPVDVQPVDPPPPPPDVQNAPEPVVAPPAVQPTTSNNIISLIIGFLQKLFGGQ